MGNSGSEPATPASTTTTTTTTPTTTTTTTTTEPPTTTTALTETPLTTSAITMDTVKEICRIEVSHLVLAFFAGVLLSTLLFVLIFYIRKKIRGPDVIKVSKALQSPDVSQKKASNEIEEGLTYARLNFQQNSESQKHASYRSRQLEIDAPSKSKEDTYASVSIKN